MSFVPVIPFGGYAGWKFLSRTRPAQQGAFTAGAALGRERDYFRERIGSVTTAEALVEDRRLLSIALGAFGLSGDIDNKYFLRKVLEDGTLDPKALGSRLADKRYLEFSRAFGFGDFAVPRTQLSDFADGLIAKYEAHRFEEAVGEQSDQMRLAMNAERELAALARRDLSADAKWYSVMASAPLREVFQTALGLPSTFAAVDIDQQLGVLKERAQRHLGSPDIAQFSDTGKIEDIVRLFLLRADSHGYRAAVSPQAAALSLLRSSTPGSGVLSRHV
ncbi:MAG: DUF1217 domain-containing protein [Paracoccaceae bacterium]